MKITEPKTPYVRYNAETDTFEGDIPDFSLSSDKGTAESPRAMSQSPTFVETSLPSPRRPSFSAPSRPGVSGRSGSASSSRSTSFNLPGDVRGDIVPAEGDIGDEVELEEEMDEETAAKHAAFVRARKGHYSNEAEAMKKAAELTDDDDEELEAPAIEENKPVAANGVVHAD